MGHSLETPLKMTFLLGYIHTCLRPLLYLSLSAGFRAQALALLRCAPPRPVGSLWGLGLGEDGQTEQSHKDEEQEQEQMTRDHHMRVSAHC
ncbi:unnamed protein product [Tetraodon nigroviridis]|uniref:(spotted green pufferfish) hypothetical protein n=1 Tax=Tetraodon nigroviridis TaxID=99883 RepID=Q4SMT0_TETNG|nr:unnamed protein product [Tetraodon nigroviridis]